MIYCITFACPVCGICETYNVAMSNGIGKVHCNSCNSDIDIHEKVIKPLMRQITFEIVGTEREDENNTV